MKKILLMGFFIGTIFNNNAIAKTENSCYTHNVVENQFRKTIPVALPISSKSKFENKNIISFSKFSDSFLKYLSDNHGDFVQFGNAIRLPNICDKTVFIAYFTDEGESENYSLNVFKDGKGDSVNFGTGSEFWIDKKYNIKVKSYSGKLAKVNYYKISDEGIIMRGDAPFN